MVVGAVFANDRDNGLPDEEDSLASIGMDYLEPKPVEHIRAPSAFSPTIMYT